ncbi:MAG: Bacteriophage Mu Gp45 protein [bacterium ADurb.Bin212]|nr:MAG: Bacteriophage Mu Gp45 protein [bacterium ADurb.Bin212]
MRITDIQRLLNSYKVRIINLLGRGFVESIDDSTQIQKVKGKLMADESLDDLERLQDYGYASNPLPSGEMLVAFPSGNRGHGIVIKCDDRRYRVKNLASGEVAIYTDEGDKIHLKRGNKIEITTGELTVNASIKAKVTAPTTEIISATGVTITTPLLNVSGLIQCAGLGAGVTPVAGKAKILGDLEATGDVSDGTRSMAGDRTIYNTHTHPENGTGGGTTSAPNEPM